MKTLKQIVEQVESGGNQYALRFEPLHYARHQLEWSHIHAEIARANKCSQPTARMIYSTSWGLYQIMGFNLYGIAEMAWNSPIGIYLGSVAAQEVQFDRYVKANGLEDIDVSDLVDLRRFAAAYNGPGNVDEYTKRLLHARDN